MVPSRFAGQHESAARLHEVPHSGNERIGHQSDIGKHHDAEPAEVAGIAAGNKGEGQFALIQSLLDGGLLAAGKFEAVGVIRVSADYPNLRYDSVFGPYGIAAYRSIERNGQLVKIKDLVPL